MAYVLTPSETKSAPEQSERAADKHAPRPPETNATARAAHRSPAEVAGSFHGIIGPIRRLFRRPLPPKELVLFASQLSIMMETGTGVVPSLEALEGQSANPRLRRAIRGVRTDVKSGQMLSDAMERRNDVFPDTLVSMVAIGESGAILDQMLDRLASILTKQAELRSTVRSALAYPLVLAGFCVLVVIFMLTFILPRFVSIFADMGAVLPLPTRFLLGSVEVLTGRWMIILPAMLAIVAGAALFLNSARGKRAFDHWVLWLPLVGPLVRNTAISRFLRSAGELTQAGVPLHEAITVSKPFVGNALYRDLIDRMEESIIAGNSMSGPIGESRLIPPTVRQMLLTSESTGALSTTMIRIADFYDERAKTQAKDLTTVLEPAMIFFVGGIVAFVVISLLLPIFKISSAVH